MAGEIYIGLMTGTSADSLDCAAVEFSYNELNIIGLKNYDIPSNLKEEISKNTRSLNVAISGAVASAEALRQNNFL